jgi:hypothetical protein
LRPAKVPIGVIGQFILPTCPVFLLADDFFSQHAPLFCYLAIFFRDMPFFSVVGDFFFTTCLSFLLLDDLFCRHALLLRWGTIFFHDMASFSVICRFFFATCLSFLLFGTFARRKIDHFSPQPTFKPPLTPFWTEFGH